MVNDTQNRDESGTAKFIIEKGTRGTATYKTYCTPAELPVLLRISTIYPRLIDLSSLIS